MPLIERTCPWCGGALVVRTNSATGKNFVGCSQFPYCHFTQAVKKSVKERLSGVPVIPGLE